MPGIDVSPLGRRRKRGTSIVPSLPAIFSTGQDGRRREMVHATNGVSEIRLPSIDSARKNSQPQEHDQSFGFTTNPVFPKDSSSYENTTPPYLRREPHRSHGGGVPAIKYRGANASSVHDWLQTVESSTVLEDGLPESMDESKMSMATCPVFPERVMDDQLDDLSPLPPIEHRNRTMKRDPVRTYRRICKLQKVTPVDKFIKQIWKSEIELKNHLLGPADIKGIAIALAIHAKVRELDVSGNNIGARGSGYLAETLQAVSQIKVLIMAATFPDVDGCKYLSRALLNNDCLRILNLAENNLGEQHAVQLCGFIKETRTLRELYLNHNRLDEAGGRVIGAALAGNKSIQILDLTWNHLRRSGAESICRALKVNTTLEKLNVSWNGFSTEGCKCLSKILPMNDTLRHLNLSSNRINSRALLFFLKGLVKNEGITSLKIGKNPFTTEAAITIIETLTACDYCSVDDLDISDVPVDDEFLEAVERLREKRIMSIRHGPLYRLEEVKQGEVSNTLGLERFDPVSVLYEYMKQDSMRLVDMFHYFDADQNGYISLAELREGFSNANIPLTEDGLEQLVKKIDNDKDGRIDLQELMVGHRKFSRSVAERNRIAKIHHKTEDSSIRDLREIIRKFLAERNEKFKETKSDAEAKTGTLKNAHRPSQSGTAKSRRISRRSRPSTIKPPLISNSIVEEADEDVSSYLHTIH
ncbi:leucine-rich repeat-containing protein 74A-like [Liolophura sinensis]|uniref:leucine-rich repeat-containing protein 74A-like n=1 Tax=Liolophura sinensis TaxID=3198878 RepID=UPI0031591B65